MGDIGTTIKGLRIQKRMTQKSLADNVGVAKSLISHYESGNREPRLEQLIAIANALQVSVSCFLEDSPEILENLRIMSVYMGREQEQQREAERVWRQQMEEEIKSAARPDAKTEKLLAAFARLNEQGKDEAIKRIGELGCVPAYQEAT